MRGGGTSLRILSRTFVEFILAYRADYHFYLVCADTWSCLNCSTEKKNVFTIEGDIVWAGPKF